MLIIFDLDDTLIDTSGCITYFKLEDALLAMQKSGLILSDFPAALELLRRLDSAAESAKDALIEFLDILGVGHQFFEIGIKEIYETISEDLPIAPLEGALETLNALSLQHQLALVSNGKEVHQLEKMKKAGIDSRLFSKIVISEEVSKLSRYQVIAEELGFCPSQVFVCGDRVSIDLAPAKELGFTTVQIQWGRGCNCTSNKNDVDYTISSLKEIQGIL